MSTRMIETEERERPKDRLYSSQNATVAEIRKRKALEIEKGKRIITFIPPDRNRNVGFRIKAMQELKRNDIVHRVQASLLRRQ